MKSYIFTALFVFIGAVVAFPTGAAGAASSAALTDTTAIFTIDFKFTSGDETIRLPIGAKIGLTSKDNIDVTGYQLQSKTEDTDATVVSNGLLFADLPVEGAYYILEPNTTVTLQLSALVTFVEPITNPETYRLQISELPYYWGEDRTRVSRERLSDMTSDPVTLGNQTEIE